MPRRQSRPRRAVSQRQITLYRALGWRYSQTREAWVHRIGGGSLGPVFIEADTLLTDGVVDDHLYQALTRRKVPTVAPEDERTPLPRRAPGEGRAVGAEVERPVTAVEVALRADEPPRVVLVDGRPPARGIDPKALADRDAVVVPLRPRATA